MDAGLRAPNPSRTGHKVFFRGQQSLATGWKQGELKVKDLRMLLPVL